MESFPAIGVERAIEYRQLVGSAAELSRLFVLGDGESEHCSESWSAGSLGLHLEQMMKLVEMEVGYLRVLNDVLWRLRRKCGGDKVDPEERVLQWSARCSEYVELARLNLGKVRAQLDKERVDLKVVEGFCDFIVVNFIRFIVTLNGVDLCVYSERSVVYEYQISKLPGSIQRGFLS
ncbi:hypothetical protein K469DRAFT_687524 [Zopfia rhizophila CBS 207.26]|uniref:Uncharacterized protein n=1 Tax=Zopfia rhizophila CBS 207.26 TaxID=1314779 RepID=A0A6A6E2V9_9PEZI|nr:hypothetical protein K469DRAFT_687524 [Zopfia rhizophila CBS 207.26]